jgi:hypothetical protein
MGSSLGYGPGTSTSETAASAVQPVVDS